MLIQNVFAFDFFDINRFNRHSKSLVDMLFLCLGIFSSHGPVYVGGISVVEFNPKTKPKGTQGKQAVFAIECSAITFTFKKQQKLNIFLIYLFAFVSFLAFHTFPAY